MSKQKDDDYVYGMCYSNARKELERQNLEKKLEEKYANRSIDKNGKKEKE
jgi:hypothetical protein